MLLLPSTFKRAIFKSVLFRDTSVNKLLQLRIGKQFLSMKGKQSKRYPSAATVLTIKTVGNQSSCPDVYKSGIYEHPLNPTDQE